MWERGSKRKWKHRGLNVTKVAWLRSQRDAWPTCLVFPACPGARDLGWWGDEAVTARTASPELDVHMFAEEQQTCGAEAWATREGMAE